MPALATTPRADLDAATERLVAASIALSYLVALPENQRAGYVKALLRYKKAVRLYHDARDAYLRSYPHRESATPSLVAA